MPQAIDDPQAIEIDPALQAARLSAAQIPVIDISPLRGAPGRAAMLSAIGTACREIGFFYAVNHGIAEARIDAVYAAARQFFALPEAQKARIAIEHSPCHRGWFRLGSENLDPARQAEGDLKEGLKIGRDLPADHERVRASLPLHGPNQWPELPLWRETMQLIYDDMAALGRQMMGAFAETLSLPRGFFDPWLGITMTTLAPLRYPPQAGRITQARIGAGAHTDYGCFTLLHQDSSGGLQVQRRDGLWIGAPPIPGSFVINIGDMLERWTNGVFRSTPHRVVNASGADRYSLAFFFDPDFYAPVECLPGCLAPGAAPLYPPTTAGAHMLEKIAGSFEYAQKSKLGAF